MANTFTFANQTLTDANIFGGINFLHDLNTGDEFTIGNTASASVNFVTDTQLPLYSKDSTNGKFTWTQNSTARGTYYITEVRKTSGKYEVTAYDAMILLDTNISALSLSLPMTVSAIASAIATYIGCTVSGTVTNGSISVSELSTDLTCRQLLHYVAEASGCSVKIDGSDHLCFMYYASSGITVSATDYVSLEVADYTCAKIDNVTIYNTEGELQAQAGSGSNALYIGSNPLLNGATNTNATNIFNVVKDFQYAPFRCEMFDENGLEIGTIATFGSTTTLVMHIESSESGAMASAVGSDSRAAYNKDILTVVNETSAIAVNAQTLLNGMSAAAIAANTTLTGIYQDAEDAKATTDEINAYATTASKTVTQILNDGETAGAAAQEAKASAQNASEYAARALGNLSTVQSVAETLTWITQHGTMTLTSDVALDPTHVYFVRNDATGYYTVGAHKYDIVSEPDIDDIGTYYVLTIDESLNNYVGTHLALDSEGLWLLPASSGTNKILIATGAGSIYTTAGTYIIGKVNGVDTLFAKFTTDGATMNATNSVEIAHLGYGSGNNGSGSTSTAPYYTLGRRLSGSTIGNYSVAEGVNTTASDAWSHAEGNQTIASGASSHAEGDDTTASGSWSHAEGSQTTSTNRATHAEGFGSDATGDFGSHAEGYSTTASGNYGSHAEGDHTTASGESSHAEGNYTTASGEHSHAEGDHASAVGKYSHAQNTHTTANGDHQTTLGKFNVADTTNAVIIGNGTASNSRSNALTVDWSGNVNIASGAKYKINGSNLSASDVSAVALSDKYTRSSVGDLGWTNQTDGDAKVIAKSALAFWSGAYSGNSSNLSKCSTGNIIGSNGGTMTGQLKTSFQTSVAMGSYGSAQSTVENFINEVRYSSGCSGSVSIGTAYTKSGVTIPTGWYNFMYMPHRSGGLNGGADGDNANYGNCFLFGMNNTNGRYIIRVSSGSIQEVSKLVTTIELNQTPSTSGLSGYSSRCTISNGGIYTIGNQVFVTMKLKIATALSANNYWTLVQGLPTPSYEQALACSGISLNGTALSAYVTTSGQIVVATDNAALANGNYITVTGWYLKA